MAKKICRQLKGNMIVKHDDDGTMFKFCVRAEIYKESVRKAAARQADLAIRNFDPNMAASAGKIMVVTQNLIDKLAYQYAFRGMRLEDNVTFKFSISEATKALSGEDEEDPDSNFVLIFVDADATRSISLR